MKSLSALSGLNTYDPILFIVNGIDKESTEVSSTALLTEDELMRYATIVCPHRRRARLVARGLLRSLAGMILSRNPRSLDIIESSGMKPRLEDGHLEFSVSHSSARVALAFARTLPVGVDIERLRLRPIDRFVENCCNRRERECLHQLSPEQRLLFLYTRWTIKEALLKVSGEGLSQSMGLIELDFDVDHPDCYTSRQGECNWTCWSSLDSSYAWAVAVPTKAFTGRMRTIRMTAGDLLGLRGS